RRRAGLSNFPGKPPAGSACPASGPRSLCATERSRSPGPSDASPDQTSDRRTRCASDNTSPPSHQSSGSHPRSASPVTSGHQLAATSQRSLPVCASSPFQSSSVAKPYFESDHFIGGGPQAHGIAATEKTAGARGQRPGEVILAEAREQGTDLL